MKKALTLILVCGMLFSLAACGESEPTDGTTTSSTTSTTASTTESTTTTTTESTTTTTTTAATTAPTECAHTFADATCTAAKKCTVCGKTDGKALGHQYADGKCTRCGEKDKNYATYKEGGDDKIIRTTADGKTTTLKIDTASADMRFQNMSIFDANAEMNISYTKFSEVDGWLYFAQTINMKYTINGAKYDITIDEMYKIKPDGKNQTALTTYVETEDKAIGVTEVFGFDGGNVYYVVENEMEGFCEIYKAPVSADLKNLITQGKKIADTPTEYAALCRCSLKDGYLYFTEKMSTYDTSISAVVTQMLDSYQMKLDGTGLKKVS
jgi:hypothetical protein